MNRNDVINLSLLSLTLLIISVLVQPLGEFCLYDDWSFAKSMQYFHETGKINFTDWTSMPLIVQLLWAKIFTFFFGFSLTTLRISTIVISFLGIYGTYFFFKEITQKTKISFFLTFIFLIQAVFLNFVFSFNTDIPFYSIIIWSAYFYLLYLNKEKFNYFIIATLFLILAILIRDIGIALTLGFAIAFIFKNKSIPYKIFIAIIPIIAGFSAIYLWKQYLISIDNLPALYDDGRVRMMKIFDKGILQNIISISKNLIWFCSYFGLFLSPLILINYNQIKNFLKNSKIIGLIILTIFVALIIVGNISSGIAEKFSDLLIHHIFGMNYFPSVYDIQNSTNITKSLFWNKIALVLGTFGFSLFLLFLNIFAKKLIEKIKNAESIPYELIFFVSSIILYSGSIILAGIYMKYLIFVMPFIMALFFISFEISNKKSTFEMGISIILTFAIMYFSISTTHDVIAEERTRWEIASELNQNHNIPVEKIDGGICFNGWHLYSYHYKESPNKNWWWVIDDEYIVVDGTVENYEVVNSKTFTRFLPPFHQVKINGLRKKNK